MAIFEQSSLDFLDALADASEILKAEGVKQRVVSNQEGRIMHAASQVLLVFNDFCGLEIAEILETQLNDVHPALNRFENQYHMTAREVTFNGRRGRPQHLYAPTKLGERVFGLFSPVES